MILFCDTPALLKLCVKEDLSGEMLALAGAATAIAVCRIAWTEIMAALARCARNTRPTPRWSRPPAPACAPIGSVMPSSKSKTGAF